MIEAAYPLQIVLEEKQYTWNQSEGAGMYCMFLELFLLSIDG